MIIDNLLNFKEQVIELLLLLGAFLFVFILSIIMNIRRKEA